MAMTPEVKVKKVVVKQLNSVGAYYFYPVTGGFGASGVPDVVGCYKGKFFGIECKAGKNKPTAGGPTRPLGIQKKSIVSFVGTYMCHST